MRAIFWHDNVYCKWAVLVLGFISQCILFYSCDALVIFDLVSCILQYDSAEFPEGYSQKNWVGVCDPLLKTLTLFMTKICDIPYPIYDLSKKSKRYF